MRNYIQKENVLLANKKDKVEDLQTHSLTHSIFRYKVFVALQQAENTNSPIHKSEPKKVNLTV